MQSVAGGLYFLHIFVAQVYSSSYGSPQQGAMAIVVSLSVIYFFFSRSGLLTDRQTPNREDQGLFLVGTLPVDHSGVVKPARDKRSSRNYCFQPWDTQLSPLRQGGSLR